jgi:GNAT superfamily N-acetyltransferase
MPEEPILREAKEADVAVLARFGRRMIEDASKDQPYPPEKLAAIEEAYVPFARAHLQDGSLKAWVIEVQGQIASCGTLLILPHIPNPIEPTRRTARLFGMYTLPEYRRRGLGRRIAEQALEHCKAQGIQRIVLTASAMGKPLYESLGFQTSKEMKLNL